MKAGLSMLLASAAALAGLSAAGCGDGDKGTEAARTDEKARAALKKLDVATTAERVSVLRGLKFKQGAPTLKIIKPEGATTYTGRQVQRNYSRERLKADETFFHLMGVIPEDTGLRELLDRFSASQILGFYDREHPDALSMVASERAAQPKAAEVTLAHELNHGLQDQNFGLRRVQDIRDPERGAAANALVEGDSTVLELAYGQEYLGGSPKEMPQTAGLPPGFLLYTAFAYQFGAEFVGALVEKGKGYELVDRAWRTRLPETTEQIMHPQKYLAGEQARAVHPEAAKVLGASWKAGARQPFGELDCLAALSTKALPTGAAGATLGEAVEGWDGGARELFTRGRDHALVVATTWESSKDAREFAAAYTRSLKRDRDARSSAGSFEIPDVGFAAVASAGRDVTLAIAPNATLAASLATRS